MMVVAWVREFFWVARIVRVGVQLSGEIRVTSCVLQSSVLGLLLFLVYVNDIWRNIESTIRVFTDNCLIYKQFINKENVVKLQKELVRLREWAAENGMEINRCKYKAVCFMRTWVKYPLNYMLGDQLFLEASSCKYLGIILRSNLTWSDHVNYTVKKVCEALHMIMCIPKRVIAVPKVYPTRLVRPILEYGAAGICTGRYRYRH
jgi:hypothetical protein